METMQTIEQEMEQQEMEQQVIAHEQLQKAAQAYFDTRYGPMWLRVQAVVEAVLVQLIQ